ncbi:fasciclin domain-containing protein [Allomuricauda sp. d1]|uniref:fasciclin domain-containing protein n=1 Tax=Allomuricauda sp. d1 TaxID=3136725 RepID=UPI0031D2AD5B
MSSPNLFPYVTLVFLAFVSTAHSQTQSLVAAPASVYDRVNVFANANNDFDENVDHQTFFKVLKAAELDCLLNEEEAYTIFVPSNKAFDNVSSAKMRALLNSEDQMQLKSLLKYHIIKGKWSASKILKALCRGGGRTTLTTVQGTKIRVSFTGSDILLTDNTGNSARITVADLEQSHGFIHQIDRVILPSRI